jgi:tetratricopeptide (TPR) repeat protein
MAKSGRGGASLAATGLADSDIYNDRIADAIARLQPAIAADEEGKNAIGATNKYLALADAHVAAGNAANAVAAVDKALAVSRRDIDLVAAARLLILADRQPQAAKLAAELNARLPTQSRAYGRLVDGWLAADAGRTAEAVGAFLESRKHADFWLARFSLGVAYVSAGAFAEALSELDTAQRRRGEAMAVFLDDVPTARYLSSLPYWLGRAQEGLGQQTSAGASYRRFLALRSTASADPLAADARKRVN